MTSTSIERALEILEGRGEVNVALSSLTTFRIGGPADIVVRPASLDDLHLIAEAVAATGLQLHVVGQGSNLLVADAGVRGIVVVMGTQFDNIAITPDGDEFVVTAQAGVKLPVLARRAASLGIAGLGWMVGVPGSVGGAVRMNAGGHGSDVAANLVFADVFCFDTTRRQRELRLSASDLELSYRSSSLGAHTIVTHGVFRCSAGEPDELDAELGEIVRWRREHQPGGANCGSVFTNPPGDSAGRLIDSAGLRGHRLGTVSVSEKHANFIQADEQASAADVWELIILVRRTVFEKFGIALHPEVKTIGFDPRLPNLS
jgi:UDP-N-acetylmuramate dehydrogenase